MPIKTSFEDTFAEQSSTIGEKLSETTGQVKDKVSDLGRTAANKIDENRNAAASGLENAASALHEKAQNLPGGEKVTNLAHSAAEKLNSTADYVRRNDINQMMGDLEKFVKNNPGPSLLGAAFVGFLVGRAFTDND